MRKALQILGVLNDEDINWLIRNGEREAHPPGAVIIHEGKPIDALMIVLEGQFTVSTQRNKKVASLYSGEILGEISMIDRQPPSATVTAVRESCVLKIQRRTLERRLETDTPFAARFYRAVALFLADRLRTTVSNLGYGEVVVNDNYGALDDDSMGMMSEAAARFDRMLKYTHAA